MKTWQFNGYKLHHEIALGPGTEVKDWAAMEKRIQLVKSFAKTIHVDIVDGKFAKNITFADPKSFAKYTKELFFEVHLMVENPLQYLQSFADAGFRRFIGHVEKMPDAAEFIARGELLGEVGLAIDKQTSIESVHVNYEDLDALLIMTIHAGFSGQKFLPDMLAKVQKVRAHAPFLPIEVDGGINEHTIVTAKKAGATRFVATSFIFNAQNPQEQYQLLERLVQEPSVS